MDSGVVGHVAHRMNNDLTSRQKSVLFCHLCRHCACAIVPLDDNTVEKISDFQPPITKSTMRVIKVKNELSNHIADTLTVVVRSPDKSAHDGSSDQMIDDEDVELENASRAESPGEIHESWREVG